MFSCLTVVDQSASRMAPASSQTPAMLNMEFALLRSVPWFTWDPAWEWSTMSEWMDFHIRALASRVYPGIGVVPPVKKLAALAHLKSGRFSIPAPTFSGPWPHPSPPPLSYGGSHRQSPGVYGGLGMSNPRTTASPAPGTGTDTDAPGMPRTAPGGPRDGSDCGTGARSEKGED